MKPAFKLYKRGKVWYSHEVSTGKRKSLGTTRKQEAEQLLSAINSGTENPTFQLKLAEAHLASIDSRLIERTWKDVIAEFSIQGGPSTLERKERIFRNPAFDSLRRKRLLQTTAEDFLIATKDNITSVIVYLRQLQNYALDMGYLLRVILPPKRFPKPSKKQQRRSITEQEHFQIIQAEHNTERKAYYEILWEIGASQTDCANLKAEDFDLSTGILFYLRQKTNQPCRLAFGSKVNNLLNQLPKKGYIFPSIQKGDWRYRAAEFSRRCRILKIKGISLHSYRYQWAERACKMGIPERLAMVALGHSSKAISRAYAKSAIAVCPSLDPIT